MKKTASVVLPVLLWVLAAGCESQGTPARVHLQVFEVPTEVLRLHTADRNPQKLADSAYAVSVVSRNDLNAILRSQGAGPGLLTDTTRVINDWPAATDAWVYSPSFARADTLYTGGGVGYLGVRDQGGQLELHLDYLVNHRGPQGQQLVESKIIYDRPYPEGQVLLFHAPADTVDGIARQHVIAFEVTRSPPAPSAEAPDVLAFR